MARILLLNDEPDLVDVCRIVLESAGHHVEALTDPVAGLATARRMVPELIILDMVMPGMSGDQVIQLLRANPRTADVPVLLMSALADGEQMARRLRVNGFLAKPFDADDLIIAAFSPDGNYVAFARYSDSPELSGIYIAEATGSHLLQLTKNEQGYFCCPVWSPDGKYILFAGSPVAHVGVAPDWFIVRTDGGKATATDAAGIFERLRLSSPTPAAWTQTNRIVFSAGLADSTNLWEIPVQPERGRVTEPAKRLTSGTGVEGNAALVAGSSPPSVVFSVLHQSIDEFLAKLRVGRIEF